MTIAKRAVALLARAMLGLAPATAALAAEPRARPQLAITATTPALQWRWAAAPTIAAQPRLLATLRGEARQDLAEARLEWAGLARVRRDSGEAAVRTEVNIAWSVLADTARLLVVNRSEDYLYAGAAHPWQAQPRVVIWDKRLQRRLPIAALFKDWPAAHAAIEAAYCQAFVTARAARLDRPAGEIANATPCTLDEAMIMPTGGRRASRFVVFDLYPDGYASGGHETELPWPMRARTRVIPIYRGDLLGTP